MSGHTPGPWQLEEVEPNDELQVKAEGYILASIWGGVGGTDDVAEEAMQANARLIAAAPDLLAALKAVRPIAVHGLHWHQQRMDENPRHDDAARETRLLAAMEAMDAAIAKAEGAS